MPGSAEQSGVDPAELGVAPEMRESEVSDLRSELRAVAEQKTFWTEVERPEGEPDDKFVARTKRAVSRRVAHLKRALRFQLGLFDARLKAIGRDPGAFSEGERKVLAAESYELTKRRGDRTSHREYQTQLDALNRSASDLSFLEQNQQLRETKTEFIQRAMFLPNVWQQALEGKEDQLAIRKNRIIRQLLDGNKLSTADYRAFAGTKGSSERRTATKRLRQEVARWNGALEYLRGLEQEAQGGSANGEAGAPTAPAEGGPATVAPEPVEPAAATGKEAAPDAEGETGSKDLLSGAPFGVGDTIRLGDYDAIDKPYPREGWKIEHASQEDGEVLVAVSHPDWEEGMLSFHLGDLVEDNADDSSGSEPVPATTPEAGEVEEPLEDSELTEQQQRDYDTASDYVRRTGFISKKKLAEALGLTKTDPRVEFVRGKLEEDGVIIEQGGKRIANPDLRITAAPEATAEVFTEADLDRAREHVKTDKDKLVRPTEPFWNFNFRSDQIDPILQQLDKEGVLEWDEAEKAYRVADALVPAEDGSAADPDTSTPEAKPEAPDLRPFSNEPIPTSVKDPNQVAAAIAFITGEGTTGRALDGVSAKDLRTMVANPAESSALMQALWDMGILDRRMDTASGEFPVLVSGWSDPALAKASSPEPVSTPEAGPLATETRLEKARRQFEVELDRLTDTVNLLGIWKTGTPHTFGDRQDTIRAYVKDYKVDALNDEIVDVAALTAAAAELRRLHKEMKDAEDQERHDALLAGLAAGSSSPSASASPAGSPFSRPATSPPGRTPVHRAPSGGGRGTLFPPSPLPAPPRASSAPVPGAERGRIVAELAAHGMTGALLDTLAGDDALFPKVPRYIRERVVHDYVVGGVRPAINADEITTRIDAVLAAGAAAGGSSPDTGLRPGEREERELWDWVYANLLTPTPDFWRRPGGYELTVVEKEQALGEFFRTGVIPTEAMDPAIFGSTFEDDLQQRYDAWQAAKGLRRADMPARIDIPTPSGSSAPAAPTAAARKGFGTRLAEAFGRVGRREVKGEYVPELEKTLYEMSNEDRIAYATSATVGTLARIVGLKVFSTFYQKEQQAKYAGAEAQDMQSFLAQEFTRADEEAGYDDPEAIAQAKQRIESSPYLSPKEKRLLLEEVGLILLDTRNRGAANRETRDKKFAAAITKFVNARVTSLDVNIEAANTALFWGTAGLGAGFAAAKGVSRGARIGLFQTKTWIERYRQITEEEPDRYAVTRAGLAVGRGFTRAVGQLFGKEGRYVGRAVLAANVLTLVGASQLAEDMPGYIESLSDTEKIDAAIQALETAAAELPIPEAIPAPEPESTAGTVTAIDDGTVEVPLSEGGTEPEAGEPPVPAPESASGDVAPAESTPIESSEVAEVSENARREMLELATVRDGDGITQVLARQLEEQVRQFPERFGLDEVPEDDRTIRHIAVKEAVEIVSAADMMDTWLADDSIGKAAVVLNGDNAGNYGFEFVDLASGDETEYGDLEDRGLIMEAQEPPTDATEPPATPEPPTVPETGGGDGASPEGAPETSRLKPEDHTASGFRSDLERRPLAWPAEKYTDAERSAIEGMRAYREAELEGLKKMKEVFKDSFNEGEKGDKAFLKALRQVARAKERGLTDLELRLEDPRAAKVELSSEAWPAGGWRSIDLRRPFQEATKAVREYMSAEGQPAPFSGLKETTEFYNQAYEQYRVDVRASQT